MGAPFAPLTRPAAKRVLDVEDVLRWAYRSQLVDHNDPDQDSGSIPLPDYPSMSPMFRMAVLGGRVDNWSRGGPPPGWTEPSPDALRVAEAVVGLARYRDHRIADPGLAHDMGFDLDQGAAVRSAMRSICTLVASHARLASRPPWEAGCHPRARISELNGKPMIRQNVTEEWEGAFGPVRETYEAPCRATRAGRYPTGAFCPLIYYPSPDSVILERAQYLVWWTALDVLARELAGMLETIAVLAPSAPARPWAGEQDLGKPPQLFGPEALPPAHVREDRKHAAARRAMGARRPLPRSPSTYAVPERHCQGNGGCNGGAA